MDRNSPIDQSISASELISPIDYQMNCTIAGQREAGMKYDSEISYCTSCQGPILERVVLKVGSSTWHVRCLRCIDCGVPLIDKCYSKNDDIFCKEDFFRRFGTRCASCDEIIPPSEVIRKAQNHIYHLECFSCISCHRQLNTGEEFFLLSSRKLMCRPDFEIAKAKEQEMDQGNKRPRTTITAKQLEALKKTYSESSKPARHIREQLSSQTGLDMRVVQVWFQNRRAKEKRMKKDANRSCWNSPYFQNRNNGCKMSSNKGDSDEQSDDQTNEPLDIAYQSDIDSDSETYSCYGHKTKPTCGSTLSNTKEDNTTDSSNSNSLGIISNPSTIALNDQDKPSTTPLTQVPFDSCMRSMDLARESRMFPPISIRDWMGQDQNGMFPSNTILSNGSSTNIMPSFLSSMNMVPGAFTSMGIFNNIIPESNFRGTNGLIHGLNMNTIN